MLKIAIITVLLLVAFFYGRKSQALHGSLREKRRRILDRLSRSKRD